MCVQSYWLAVGGAVDTGRSEQVEATRRVEAAAALSAVAQAVVSILHQRLAGSQHTSLTKYTHRLAHWTHAHRREVRTPFIFRLLNTELFFLIKCAAAGV